MAHWKLTISYDGSSFHGWQIQPNGLPTVQAAFSEAIHHLTGESVQPQGSGRTDAGVHALAQVISFPLNGALPPTNFLRALNRVLPQSIRVLQAELVPESFHARHSARGKTYEYRVFERRVRQQPGQPAAELVCSPFLAPFVWDCRWPLDFELMQQASRQVLGTHDFTSFAASDPDKSLREDGQRSGPNPVKTIDRSEWTREDGLLIYRVHGTGFLHHMVRNLVGTFVDVGRGAILPDEIPTILAARNRTAAGPTAPARGLFLKQVDYEAQAPQAGKLEGES
ncbi:tRNA pseudouridine(38-40) synthase TruA [Granulicella cerasi]|uniref:tRNA pseudouridine synthase A n=1 Tax=Granulicella cerasi TaxID=741063 RepID=A0ABW1Z4K5_9BACT|nr:tRNA pseudouridine(38-40) synthase TruA [Granulicella cerasi]